MVLPFKDYSDVFILGGTDDIQVNLDESHINVQTIASSRYVGPIKPRVDEWVKQLDLFTKTLVSGTVQPAVPELLCSERSVTGGYPFGLFLPRCSTAFVNITSAIVLQKSGMNCLVTLIYIQEYTCAF